jgi:SAM-dependent methyltransferase
MADYDNFAERPPPTGLGEWRMRNYHQFLLSKIQSHSGDGELELLEIGPGKGAFARTVATREDLSYTAIEPNTKMAETLESDGFDVTESRVPPIPYEQDFDIIYLDQVFEHLPPDSVKDFLEECRRHLTRNGIIVIVAPDYNVWGRFFLDSDYTHRHVTTLNRTEQVLFDKGFDIGETGYVAYPFRGASVTKLLALAYKLFEATRVPHLLLSRPRRHKVKSSLFRSFYIIANPRQAE